MTEKKMITLQVTEERKARWEQAVDESPEIGTLSGFIRGAVEARINGGPTGRDETGDTSEMLNEILESVHESNVRLSELEGRVSTMEGLVRGEPEIEDLADRLFGLLPSEDSLRPLSIERRSGGERVVTGPNVDQWNESDDETPIRELSDDRLVDSGHVLALAEVTGETPYNVEKALDELKDEPYVGATKHAGETLYFRKE